MDLINDPKVKLFMAQAMSAGVKFENSLNNMQLQELIDRSINELESHPFISIFLEKGPKSDDLSTLVVEDVAMNKILMAIFGKDGIDFSLLSEYKSLTLKDKKTIFHTVLNIVGAAMDIGHAGHVIPKGQELITPNKVQDDFFVMV
mgnify:CR=1 FL=1|tara:strand:- start:362 stop:799 length:438 start_codon:yes stop_codon:yes gene_type:complete